MLDYLRNILPRIQGYSKSLDRVEVFVEKPWVLFDERNNLHEYMFMRDKRLILSLNGIVKEGKWELLPNGKLLIDRVDDKILLQNMFIDDAVMILKMSGTADVPFLLVNEHRVPDRDVMKYLELVEEQQHTYEPLAVEERKKNKILKNGLVQGASLFAGQRVEGSSDNEIVTGIFQTTIAEYKEFVEITNGIIIDKYYVVDYKYNGQTVQIKQRETLVQKNDLVLKCHTTSTAEIQTLKVTDRFDVSYMLKLNLNGTILAVNDVGRQNLVFIFLTILIILVAWLAIMFAKNG